MRVRYVGAIAALVVATAACGSSGSKASDSGSNTTSAGAAYGKTSSTAQASTTTATGGTAAGPVKVAEVGDDKLVVDAKGMTVYAFSPDSATTSACNAGCDTVWPPVVVTGAPPSTIEGLPVTTLMRSDGKQQVVVNGHPVYTFSGDTKVGDKNGQGVASKWYYVNSKGEPDKG